MGIFSRFADIINSNLTALLDKAEDPEKMVRLIIQEMEDTLIEVRSNSAKTLADKKELSRRLARLHKDIELWQGKAELAISKNRDDLARAALMEKAKLEEQSSSLETELALLTEQIDRLHDEISQLQAKLTDAKNRKQALILKQNTMNSRLDVKKQIDSGKLQDTLHRFESYERKIDELEANVDSYDLGNKSLESEFAELEAQGKVDDELAALKNKMKTTETKD